MTSPASSAPTASSDRPASSGDEIEDLLYIITHDLRAGFRALQLIPDFIREDLDDLPPFQAEVLDGHVEMLKVQARRCDQMLLDLREYSRVGRCAEAPANQSTQEIIDRALRLAPLPGGFRLLVQGDGQLRGPANELAQLFAALLSNAVKHHDRSGGLITITLGTGVGICRVSVLDDGPGIPPRFREEAFDMLRTLRSRDECEGSGMGLTTARKIVTRLGGEISVTDRGADRGAEITFTLPSGAPV